MNKLTTRRISHLARIGLGLMFLVFGLNGFLHFLPQPELPAAGGQFLGALAATGYMLPLIKGIEVVAGILLLSNRFVPLALAVLAPIAVNILAFHAALAPSGLPVALVIVAAELYLAWAYRGAFAPMLRAQTRPTIHNERTSTVANTSASVA